MYKWIKRNEIIIMSSAAVRRAALAWKSVDVLALSISLQFAAFNAGESAGGRLGGRAIK